MANVKISQLPTVTSNTSGDLIPIVQSSTTDAITFANFEASLTVANQVGGTATGTGNIVRASSPTLTTPALGVAAATTVNKVTITTPATGSTLTIVDGKTLKADNSLELAGTDSTVMTFPSTSQTIVGRTSTDTLTNKTLTSPVISSISNSGTITLPTSTDTLVGRATTDTLTNKTLTSPAINQQTVNYIIGTQVTISASAIDWHGGTHFTKTLSGNTTFTFSNNADTLSIIVFITNTTGNFTVTWPTVSWVGGSAPTQTIGAHTDIYNFVQAGGTIYGAVIQNY